MTAHYADRYKHKSKKEKRRVVITGVGAVTPLGNDIESSWENLVCGKSGIAPITLFDASYYPVKIAAEVKNFDPGTAVPEEFKPFIGRSTGFCLKAAEEAVKNAGLNLDLIDTSQIGISIGTDEESASFSMFEKMFENPDILEMMMARKSATHGHYPLPHLNRSKPLGKIWPFRRNASIAASMLSIIQNINGPVSTSSSACASSAQAIGRAARMIQDRDAEIMVTGGCDSMIGEFSLTGFAKIKALSKNNDDPEKASRPFDMKRDGFVLGEGAGILILEELSHAQQRGAKILGEITGYGSSSNAYKITATPENGCGPDIAMKTAINEAGGDIDQVDHINAHGTSTYLNDKSETAAIKNVFHDRAYRIPVSSNKSMMGHLVASAAAIEMIMSVLTLNRDVIPPTINYENPDPDCDLDYVPNKSRNKKVETILSNSFAFGGQNASILVKKFQ